jgi:hypothetical protein
MTNNPTSRTLRLLLLGALGALISCDGAMNGAGATPTELAAGDCPFGTFRPSGLNECVFPAQDINNGTVMVSDNRCAFGQPATPPSCVSDAGLRPYLAVGPSCAPGYRFEDGSCNRNSGPLTGGSTGVAGFTTGGGGFFGTGTGGIEATGGVGGFFDACETGGCSGTGVGGESAGGESGAGGI